jgi:aminoglycoside phosphotransferase (APT) family kinase protein
LRRFHDTTVGTDLAGDAEVVCHNDYGPWNLVWRRGEPVAMFDFDESAPGDRVADVGYAVWKFLNLGVLTVSPDEQARRLDVFIGTYGDLSADAAVNAVLASQDRMEQTVQHVEEAARGVRTERAWVEANAGVLARS